MSIVMLKSLTNILGSMNLVPLITQVLFIALIAFLAVVIISYLYNRLFKKSEDIEILRRTSLKSNSADFSKELHPLNIRQQEVKPSQDHSQKKKKNHQRYVILNDEIKNNNIKLD